MRPVAVSLLALAGLLAGCGGPSPQEPPLGAADETPPVEGLLLEDCQVDDVFAFVEKSRMDPLVPDKYDNGGYFAMRTPTGTALADASLRVYECRAVSATGTDDRALLGVSLGFIYDKGGDVLAYGADNDYLLELFVDLASAPRTARFLDDHGIAYLPATIARADDGFSIEADGIRYDVGIAATGPALPVVSENGFGWQRWHQAKEDSLAFLDVVEPDLPGGEAYATIAAQGGAWGALAGPGNPEVSGSWAQQATEAAITAWRSPEPLPFPQAAAQDHGDGLDLLDCQGLEFQLQVPAASAQDMLPEGYVAGQHGGIVPPLLVPEAAATARADLDVLTCNVFLDQAWQGYTTFAWTTLLLSSASGNEGNQFRDVYVLEWFADGASDAVLQAIRDEGFPVALAEVEWSRETGARITADGSEYAMTCGPDNGLSGNGLAGQRDHVMTDRARWADLDGSLWRSEPGSPSPWTARGGALAQLQPSEGVAQPAGCADFYGRLSVSFG